MSAAGQSLQVVRDGPVVVLRLDRPQVLNALDTSLIAALLSAVEDVSRAPDVRCLVLAGPAVEAFLVAHPRVMFRMLQAQARRLRAANRWRS